MNDRSPRLVGMAGNRIARDVLPCAFPGGLPGQEGEIAAADCAVAGDFYDQGHRGEVEGVQKYLGQRGIRGHDLIDVHIHDPQAKGIGGGKFGLADGTAFGVEDYVAPFAENTVPVLGRESRRGSYGGICHARQGLCLRERGADRSTREEVFHHTCKAYDFERVLGGVPDPGTREDIFIDERDGAFLADFVAAGGQPVEKVAFQMLEEYGVALG